MSYRFSLSDIGFLTSPAGAEAVAAVGRLPLTDASYLADVRAARELVGERAGAVLETVLLRRRASSKVDDPTRWLFTDSALQQATPVAVARHRAARFAGRSVHDVTCSIGVDLAALAEVAQLCVGSDLDPVRLAMARSNTGLPVFRADALHPTTRGTAVFADPARRDAAGRRRWRPADFQPPLDALPIVYDGRDLAVKCAPGIDLAEVPWADEVEIISLDGQVRQACLWRGSLATPGVRRRATVLRTAQEPAHRIRSTDPSADRIQSTDVNADRIRSTGPPADRIPSTDAAADRMRSADENADRIPSVDTAVDRIRCSGADADCIRSTPSLADRMQSSETGVDRIRSAPPIADRMRSAADRTQSAGVDADCIHWTVTDADPDDCPVRAPGEWIIDPDGAVVRAGLVRQYAAQHGLGQLDERIAYLTGDAPPAGIRAFRVVEYGHYSEKALRAALRRLGVGRLEILVRGLDLDPNKLRPRLRLAGDGEASVVLTRIGRGPVAFICRAERT